ncbi:DNA repair protein RecO [Deefgea piscis]|uniref:DNA repair protein RecO n=1 Tax=Deefgea piscis TaxID=2739061 RepID=UPI001C7E6F3A|nr:DNA repair protein RecO [Deefgea piscis]QZA79933.1 DNA repair protein RecO [Deefgea piscis]
MTRSSSKLRINLQPAFVLHQYAYRETSRLLDVFSRDHGRLTLYARGVQRPGSQIRSVLLGFQPLLLSWFGGGELKTLHAAQWQPGLPQLSGLPLLCGFYMNELLQRLCPKEEANPALFAAYFSAIQALGKLGTDQRAVEPILRLFERQLLDSLGYGIDWQRIARSDQPLNLLERYEFEYGVGLVPSQSAAACPAALVLAFAAGDFTDQQVLPWAKMWMRQSIAAVLGDSVLHTRQLLIDLQKL